MPDRADHSSNWFRGLAFGLVTLISACTTPSATVEPTSQPSPASVPSEARGFGPWHASVGADHPLVGTAWLVGERRELGRDELEQRLGAATFVLLGETHDHPDHHRLQGELIASSLEPAPSPAVAFEMLDPANQIAIDEFMAADTRDVDGFAELVHWADSGWPAWSLYRPVFVPVIEARLPVLAAQFPRDQSKRFMSEGLAMLDPKLVTDFALDQPLAPELLEIQLDEMFTSHCEMVPREQLGPMVEIQRIRDAVMADAMARGAEQRGRVVLVAGTGHTRATAVPRLLAMIGVEPASIVSVGFVSVRPEQLDARDYFDGDQQFDVVVFTPDIEREDPCAGM